MNYTALLVLTLLLGCAYKQFEETLIDHSEQRQQRIEQEIKERVDAMREVCRLQYPHDIYMRAKCYQKMMANV